MSEVLVKAAGRYSETAIDDEVVVMNIASGQFFALTDSARDIWNLIDGTRDRDGILAELSRAYQVEREAICADVDDFLAQLHAAGLLAD